MNHYQFTSPLDAFAYKRHHQADLDMESHICTVQQLDITAHF